MNRHLSISQTLTHAEQGRTELRFSFKNGRQKEAWAAAKPRPPGAYNRSTACLYQQTMRPVQCAHLRKRERFRPARSQQAELRSSGTKEEAVRRGCTPQREHEVVDQQRVHLLLSGHCSREASHSMPRLAQLLVVCKGHNLGRSNHCKRAQSAHTPLLVRGSRIEDRGSSWGEPHSPRGRIT